MPIGTPVSLGTVSQADTANTSIALTLATAIVKGDLAVVAVFISDAGQLTTVSTVSDGTNNYSRITGTSDSQNDVELWYKANATAVAAGSITVNFSGTTSGVGQGQLVCAARIPAVQLLTPRYKAAAASAAATNVSVSSGTLVQGYEIAIGMTAAARSLTPSYTQSSGFSSVNFIAPGGNSIGLGIDYNKLSSTASVTYDPIWSGGVSIFVASILATFKGLITYIASSAEYPQEYQRTGLTGY